MELLLHTLTEVVRDHLEGGSSRETGADEIASEIELEKVLGKK